MDKLILITGSSRGIGEAIAKLAYDKGYKVVIHGKTDSQALKEAQKEMPEAIKTVFDITDAKQTLEEIAKVIKEHGPIDILINNAGRFFNRTSDVSDSVDADAIEEFRANVLGTIHCTQAVIPAMKKQGKGSIVNIASIKGHHELSTMSSFTFGATKAGVISITKSMARHYAKDGIRINSVSPGYVETDQVKDWNTETFARINEGTLLKRMARPEEIAPLVLFIASDEASYMVGEDVLIDGGHKLA